MSLLSICETEILDECVRKDICLCDKSSKSSKDKHTMDNVWRKFEKELGF